MVLTELQTSNSHSFVLEIKVASMTEKLIIIAGMKTKSQRVIGNDSIYLKRLF